MTVADARTAAWLFDKLDKTNRMLETLNKSKEFLTNGVIEIGGRTLYEVPRDIEKEVFNLLVKRLEEERDRLKAKIDAL